MSLIEPGILVVIIGVVTPIAVFSTGPFGIRAATDEMAGVNLDATQEDEVKGGIPS